MKATTMSMEKTTVVKTSKTPRVSMMLKEPPSATISLSMFLKVGSKAISSGSSMPLITANMIINESQIVLSSDLEGMM